MDDRRINTYTRAAAHFDTLPFWHHFGRGTVARLHLRPGESVLDLCCGTGASALPAAEAVGPTGRVTGVDLTAALVQIAASNARTHGLTNTTFVVADIETLGCAPASFDAVLSVFGLFFVSDMAAMLARAWGWLRPGGRLAITAWGETVLEPGEALFWEAVLAEDPGLMPVSPSARLETPELIAATFARAGLPPPAIERESWQMPLAAPEDFWRVILGTSNVGALHALPGDAQARVREFVLGELARRNVRALAMDALYATARTPERPR